MSKPSNVKIKQTMLTGLNDFMKDFGIDSIEFGKTHSVKKTKGKMAKDIVKPRKRK